MANSYTRTEDSVFGNMRIVIGTYTATDGGDQGVISTGLNDIVFASCQEEGQGCTHTAGSVDLVTATSGSEYTVLCIGR